MTAHAAMRSGSVDAEDILRADFYDFLAALLAAPPSDEMLGRVSRLAGDESAIGQGIAALARASARPRKDVEREFNALFIGLGRGEILPHASYYLTGFLNEKPLARLRRDMARLGIARAEGVAEPEDRIASLLEMMAGLIRGRFGAPASLAVQREFFDAHLAPWAGHFFADLEGAEAAEFYAPVGRIGHAFIKIERDAFRMEG